MEGYGNKDNIRSWNRVDSSKKLKTMMKKMDKYNKTWDYPRNFAIIKSEGAVRGKMALRDADRTRQCRTRAKRNNDQSWRWDLKDKIKNKGKKEKNYWGEIMKLSLKNTQKY